MGQTFNRWTVIGGPVYFPASKYAKVGWLCRCECGTERPVLAHSLRKGFSKSCNCWRDEVASRLFVTHGQHGSYEYQSWQHAKDRCYNVNNQGYADYGGRGITVCDEWRSSFERFYADMGPRPKGHSIDRIDNNGPYSPENCRWANPYQQTRNTRRNVRITFNGLNLTLTDWAITAGIPYERLRSRMERGWPIDRALTEPSHRTHVIA